jgi:hypothetical protein
MPCLRRRVAPLTVRIVSVTKRLTQPPECRRWANSTPSVIAAAVMVSALGCDEARSPSSATPQPGATTVAVRIVFQGATTRRTNLPASVQACLDGVGATHIHPSWRSFAGIPLTPFPPDRYEIAFADVPVNTRVSFRVNDQNACDENPTGAVIRNIFANEVRLAQNTTTPGNGDEPGFAFSIGANGSITQ